MTDSGTHAENLIGKIAALAFVEDFVFMRPAYWRGGKGREHCDVLIELESQAVCCQVKAQDASARRTGIEEDKWVVKQLLRGQQQARGALRVLKDQLGSVRGTNPRRGLVEFKPGELRPLHAIVLIDVASQIRLADNLPRRVLGGIPIHYFSFRDFLGLTQALGTIPDLLHYLEERARLPAWSTPNLGAENDAYAYYLTHRAEFTPTVGRQDFEGAWEDLTVRHRQEYEQKLDEDSYAEIVDRMVDEIHDLDPAFETDVPDELKEHLYTFEDRKRRYIEIAQELNKLPKIMRRAIGRELIQKARLSVETNRPRHFATGPAEGDTIYAFLATSLPRKERVKRLAAITYAAKVNSSRRRALGVAAPDLSQTGHSFDFVLFDADESPPQDVKEMAGRMFSEVRKERLFDFPSEEHRIVLPEDSI